jgi:hypothetical protein
MHIQAQHLYEDLSLLTARFPASFECTLSLGGDVGRPSEGKSADTTYTSPPCVLMAS